MSEWRKEFAKVVNPESKVPRNRVEIVIRLGAGSWLEAMQTLDLIQHELYEADKKGQDSVNVTSGAGYTLIGSEDRSVTKESYSEALGAYFRGDRQ